MQSSIERLYYGDWGGQTNVTISRAYTKAADRAERYAEKLKNLLQKNAAAVEAFEKFREAYEEAIASALCDHYKAGFQNAVRLMADALGEA